MKNFALIVCWLPFSFGAFAQHLSSESIANQLKALPQDTARVNFLNNISAGFIQSAQFDSVLLYAKPSMGLSEKLQYAAGEMEAYHHLSAFYFHIKEYKIGKFFLLKSLNAAILLNHKKNIAGCYKELADLYKLQGNFKLATESNSKSVLYADSLKQEDSIKHAAELQTAYNLKEKEKAGLAAVDAKAQAEYDVKKQQVFYISLAVLVVLSLLIIWLLVSKSKLKKRKKAEFLAANAEMEQDKATEILSQPNNIDAEKKAFLQKLVEKELSATNRNVDKKLLAMPDEKTLVVHEEEMTNHANEEKNTIEEKPTVAQPVEIVSKDLTHEPEEKPIEKNNENDLEIGTYEPVPNLAKGYSGLIAPSQLQNFTARLVENKVKLFWQTDNESNISYFELQKSVGDSQFITIETYAAKGFQGNRYEVFDLQPLPGINYYRLEIIDTEGNFIFGPTVHIVVLPATTLELAAYPTRVKDVVMVTAAGAKMPVLVNVFNKIGKKEFTLEIPPATTPVYLNSLSAGTYTLQMKCQGKTVLQQLVKIM